MRMRKRHNLEPRLERCAGLIVEDPQSLRGHWRDLFPDCSALMLELGCGKGRFTAGTAAAESGRLLIALEKVPDAMIIALERCRDAGLDNVRFINGDAAALSEMFAPGEVDRIYINFCDPWPKSRDAKFRLTAPNFLRSYRDILAPGGEIHFKTDNAPLFEWSLGQMTDEHWELHEITRDLHEYGIQGIMTDYEAKFHEEGIKINRLVARRTDATLGTAAGPVPRLRNASLTDAKGFEESQAAAESGEKHD